MNQLDAVNTLFDTVFKTLPAEDTVPQLPPRLRKQLAVEQAIVSFNPDLVEAQEILDALLGSLKARFPAHQLVVVEEEASALRIALGEAQPYEPSDEDRKYNDHVYDQMDEARGL